MNKTLDNIFKGDKVIWMVFFFLCLISVVEVYSASAQLTYKGGNYLAPIIKHVGLLLAGIVSAIVVLNIQCKYFKVVTPIMLIVSFFTLLWAILAGEMTNEASRWVSILGIKFQPSEIAKGTMVLATAQILSATQTEKGTEPAAFKYILGLTGVMAFLIGLENLSTAALLCLVILMMMFVGRVPLAQLGKLMGVGMLLILGVFMAVMLLGRTDNSATAATPSRHTVTEISAEKPAKKAEKGLVAKLFHRASTWKARIEKFADASEVSPDSLDIYGDDSQVSHANIAIVSSNIRGKGPGNSEERDFLSQAFSDFIYAIIIEELGIAGAIGVAFLYIVLLFRTASIARRCENYFPSYLAIGLALLLVTQALFNMCVAVGLAPVTGQPLPLISKGGTSTIINCVYIGAILSISLSAKKRTGKSVQPEGIGVLKTA